MGAKKWTFKEGWVPDPPELEFFELSNKADLKEFTYRYLDVMDGREALTQILRVVHYFGEVICVVEPDYVDRDYRDEFANFYAQTFRSLVDRCQRLHFYAGNGATYLGYSVLRPIHARLISRTMIAPPPPMEPFISCLTSDSASLQDIREETRATPFISQDFQYGVCAHAAIWMVARYFNLRFGAPRRQMSDIVEGSRNQRGNNRIIPSRGLTARQIVAVMDELGMYPLSYKLKDQASRDDAELIARSYLDSEIPVILTEGSHARVLIGYFHDEEGNRVYIAHDDVRGPYHLCFGLEEVDYLLVPSPGRIYLEAHVAETAAAFHFNDLMETDDIVSDHLDAFEEGDLRLRAYLTEIGDYRARLSKRGFSTEAVGWLAMSGASHWVWVVELQSEKAAAAGRRCVIGEMVVDATTDERNPHVLFGLMPGKLYRWSEPKTGQSERKSDQNSLYDSGRAIHSITT